MRTTRSIEFATAFIKSALAEKEATEKHINELRTKETETPGNEKYKLFEERQKLYPKFETEKAVVLLAENGVKAVKNNGEIIQNYTDKKGRAYIFIPDFRKIQTTAILFDEETILTEETPAYIPKVDEELIKRKGFVLDAIRIDKDSYLISLSEHKEDGGGYVVLTLDQLVLASDYYITRAKATNILKAKQRTQKQEEYYDKLSAERRERHLMQKKFYYSLPLTIRRKISEEDYEKLTWQEREKIYKPFKRYGPERITSKLDEHHMWLSTHKMYERFINPDAKQPKQGYAHEEVFDYWRKFREFLDYKIKDIEVHREDLSDVRKAALETSFGVSNTNDALLEKYGILVKRQNGDKINPAEIAQIESAWIKVNKVYGNMKPISQQVNLKISHSGDKFIFASKAIGMWVPSFSTIAASNKFGADEFDDTTGHETAHLIDYYIGKANGKRYATDDYESTAGEIAFTFRKNLNFKTDSNYINSTKECFARALQQYFAVSSRGESATLLYSEGSLDAQESYFVSNNFVNQTVFTSVIKPLIEKFFQEQKEIFKTAFVESEVEPVKEDAKPIVDMKQKKNWKVTEIEASGKKIEKFFETNEEARRYYDDNSSNGSAWGITPGPDAVTDETFRYEKRKGIVYRIGNKTGEESYMGKASEFGRLPGGQPDKPYKFPTSVFYAEIKPIREGADSKQVRISPDAVGDFIAGYVIYETPFSNKKVGYIKKDQLKEFLESGEYKIIDKPLHDELQEFVIKYVSKENMKKRGKLRGVTKIWFCAKSREDAISQVKQEEDFGVLISCKPSGKTGPMSQCELEKENKSKPAKTPKSDRNKKKVEDKKKLKAVFKLKEPVVYKNKQGDYNLLGNVEKIYQQDGVTLYDVRGMDGSMAAYMADELKKPSKIVREKDVAQYIADLEKQAPLLKNMGESQIIQIGLQFHQLFRTNRAQGSDTHHDSKKRLSPTPENLLRWMKHPGQFDLIGVDTFQRTDQTADYKREISKQKFWNLLGIKINVDTKTAAMKFPIFKKDDIVEYKVQQESEKGVKFKVIDAWDDGRMQIQDLRMQLKELTPINTANQVEMKLSK